MVLDTMVHLTEENDFIALEGDEHLSSPIDRRPTHLYQPIALQDIRNRLGSSYINVSSYI
jgi:hypothetical protein